MMTRKRILTIFTKLLFISLTLCSFIVPAGITAGPVTQQVVDTIFALDSRNNTLIRFTSDNPGRVLTVGPMFPFVGIDFRPADGRLYGLTESPAALYQISTTSGSVTMIGSPLAISLDGDSFGFDFNPIPDRIRLTSDNDQNVRLNPNDGTLTATDGRLNYVMQIGGKANVVASAYTNSFGPSPRQTPGTTLYGIDSLRDALVVQNPPNDGVLSIVGPLGVDVGSQAAFDIVGADNTAYAAFVLPGRNVSTLFSINLTTGQATVIGEIGARGPVTAMAVAPRQ